MTDKQEILNQAKEEYERAGRIHGYHFHSIHEAYAVMLEEVEETSEEVDMLKRTMSKIWECARTDNEPEYIGLLDDIEHFSMRTVQEAIQVLAMVTTARRSL